MFTNRFRNFLTGPTFPEDENKSALAQVSRAYFISMVILCILAVPAIFLFFKEKLLSLSIILIVIITLTTLWVIVRRGFVYIAAGASLLIFWIITTLIVYISGGMHSLNWAFYIPGTVAAGLFFGNRGTVLYAAASLVAGLAMTLSEMNGYPLPRLFSFPPLTGWTLLLFNLCVTVLPVVLHTNRLNNTLSQVKHELDERKHTEHELLLSNYCIEQASVGIMRTGPDARVLFANDQYCQLSGYTLEELSRMHIYEIDPTYPKEKWKAHRENLKVHGSSTFETVHKRRDGALIPVEIRNRYLEFKDSGFAVSFINDISMRKQAELERENLIEQLEAKNRELEQFTYTVSHDLKAPLITMHGFLGHLEEDIKSGNHERMKKDMSRIVEAGHKMEDLLNDLLELSRIGRVANPSETVAFESIVNEAIERVTGSLTKYAVRIDIEEGLPEIYGDRTRLIQVMQNLIDNACKFMGDQISPLIGIGQNGKDSNGNFIFFVRDNGIGIDPKHHERIFRLFNKLNVTADGTGIGLALVKRIIEVHGGRIWVESEGVGKGSAFYFTLMGSNHEQTF